MRRASAAEVVDVAVDTLPAIDICFEQRCARTLHRAMRLGGGMKRAYWI
jgi:hypothetical protein